MAGIADPRIRLLKKYMDDISYTYTDEWLLACVGWILENDPASNNDLEIIKRELRDQWKDANLEELESSCLPGNLAGQRLVKLPKKYGLQVNYVQDIGASCYSQWTKIKKLENENASVAATDSNELTPSWQPTPKSCLYLTMTDGMQTVFGLEMESIPGLSLNIKPGIKLVIVGPVDCRRGVIHLRRNNVRIEGGEVEDFQDTNRVENVLARALKMAPTPLSQSQNRSTAVVSTNSAGRAVEVIGDFPDSEDQFPDISEFGADEDDDLLMDIDEQALISSASTTSSNSSVTNPTQSTASTIRLAPISSNSSIGNSTQSTASTTRLASASSNSSVTNQTQSTASTSTFRPVKSTAKPNAGSIGKQKNILQYLKPMPVVINPQTPPEVRLKRRKRNAEVPTTSEPEVPLIINEAVREELIEDEECDDIDNPTETNGMDDDSFHSPSSSPPDESLMRLVDATVENRLLECIKDEPESVPPQSLSTSSDSSRQVPEPVISNSNSVPKMSLPVATDGHPYTFLKQVEKDWKELVVKRRVIYVKACVSTVASNVKVDNGQWTLSVCINDGTGYLVCKINSSIVSGLIGFTPKEMKQIKATKTAEGKQKINQGLTGLATKLVNLNAIFSVEVAEEPTIIEITDIKQHHHTAVRTKLEQLGL